MGKNRNKHKHRRGGGKFMHSIEKQKVLEIELNKEWYDYRSLIKIDKNLGYGFFNVINVKNGMKMKAYCRYMFTRRSPEYAIAEGKDDFQLVAPVSDSCAGQYILKNRFETNIASEEEKYKTIDDSVSFYTEEELAGIESEKTNKSRKAVIIEEKELLLKEAEREEKESVRSILQVLIPKLEMQLEKAVKHSPKGLPLGSLENCLKNIEKLKAGCTRDEAKEFYTSFKISLKTV